MCFSSLICHQARICHVREDVYFKNTFWRLCLSSRISLRKLLQWFKELTTCSPQGGFRSVHYLSFTQRLLLWSQSRRVSWIKLPIRYPSCIFHLDCESGWSLSSRVVTSSWRFSKPNFFPTCRWPNLRKQHWVVDAKWGGNFSLLLCGDQHSLADLSNLLSFHFLSVVIKMPYPYSIFHS